MSDNPEYTCFLQSGCKTADPQFSDQVRERTNALAAYNRNLVLESGKTLSVGYQGGIANKRHTTDNFKFFMGYKVNGQDQWQEMTWRESPNTTYTSFSLEWTPPEMTADTMAVWFEARYEKDGEQHKEYDSNNGMNYSAHVVGRTTKSVCFTKDWREALQGGDLQAGDSVQIVYDYGRIYQLLNYTTYNGHPAWDAQGFYQVYNKDNQIISESSFPLVAHALRARDGRPATEKPHFTPAIRIPQAAAGGRLVLWFRGFDRSSGAWDSDHGANYVVPVR